MILSRHQMLKILSKNRETPVGNQFFIQAVSAKTATLYPQFHPEPKN
jgi:hypothetical protein